MNFPEGWNLEPLFVLPVNFPVPLFEFPEEGELIIGWRPETLRELGKRLKLLTGFEFELEEIRPEETRELLLLILTLLLGLKLLLDLTFDCELEEFEIRFEGLP